MAAFDDVQSDIYTGDGFRFSALYPMLYNRAPVAGRGAMFVSGRFNPSGAFPLVYLASHPHVALEEVGLTAVGGVHAIASAPKVLWSVNCKLRAILDLTDPTVRLALGTTKSEMTGIWQPDPDDLPRVLPPTQLLARAVHLSGKFDAIRYPSAKYTSNEHFNFAVFPDRLAMTKGALKVHSPEPPVPKNVRYIAP